MHAAGGATNALTDAETLLLWLTRNTCAYGLRNQVTGLDVKGRKRCTRSLLDRRYLDPAEKVVLMNIQDASQRTPQVDRTKDKACRHTVTKAYGKSGNSTSLRHDPAGHVAFVISTISSLQPVKAPF